MWPGSMHQEDVCFRQMLRWLRQCCFAISILIDETHPMRPLEARAVRPTRLESGCHCDRSHGFAGSASLSMCVVAPRRRPLSNQETIKAFVELNPCSRLH